MASVGIEGVGVGLLAGDGVVRRALKSIYGNGVDVPKLLEEGDSS